MRAPRPSRGSVRRQNRDHAKEIGARPVTGRAPRSQALSRAGGRLRSPATFGPTGRELAARCRAVVYWPRVPPALTTDAVAVSRRPADPHPLDLAERGDRLATAGQRVGGRSENRTAPRSRTR